MVENPTRNLTAMLDSSFCFFPSQIQKSNNVIPEFKYLFFYHMITRDFNELLLFKSSQVSVSSISIKRITYPVILFAQKWKILSYMYLQYIQVLAHLSFEFTKIRYIFLIILQNYVQSFKRLIVIFFIFPCPRD